MKDDFLKQFRKPPRRQFAADLYERISKPMEMQPKLFYGRRLALATAIAALVLALAVLISPPVRAFADQILRQIGAFTFVDRSSQIGATERAAEPPVPTAEPPVAGQVRAASDAAEASSLAGFTVLAPTYLPSEYSQEGNWSVTSQGNGVVVVSSYRSQDGHFFLLNQFQYGPGDSYEQSYYANEEVQDVTVRGHAGVWLVGRSMTDPWSTPRPGEPELLATNWLVWDENGVNYSLFGDALDQAEMQNIAKSLTP